MALCAAMAFAFTRLYLGVAVLTATVGHPCSLPARLWQPRRLATGSLWVVRASMQAARTQTRQDPRQDVP
jgi:hypothetical protein